jgi:hypothetical protein
MSWELMRPVLLLLTAFLAARAEIIDRIAVSVGNRVVTLNDLEREIRISAFINGVKPDLSPASRRVAAERMVDQKLILREIENSRYPAPKPAEIDPLLAQLRKQRFPTEAAYRAALSEAGITEQDLRDSILWQRTLLMFLDVRFRPGIQIAAKEIQDYFDQVVAPMARAANPGATVSPEDYRDQIERTLVGRMVDEETTRWIAEARRRTEVVFHQEVFQ